MEKQQEEKLQETPFIITADHVPQLDYVGHSRYYSKADDKVECDYDDLRVAVLVECGVKFVVPFNSTIEVQQNGDWYIYIPPTA